MTEDGAAEQYKAVRTPVKFISFFDDELLAPRKSVEALAASYGSERTQHEHLTPKNTGSRPIGHFNFFREKYAALWPRITEWFEKSSGSRSMRNG